MGLLLIGLAITEAALYLRHRPLLSQQRGWRRAGVLAAWVAFGVHLTTEGVR